MAKDIDYDKLLEITVKSQEELDAIPDSFSGRIYVEFGTCFNKAIVNKRYGSSVVACGNSSVVALENSSVVARESSSVEARGNSSVEAWENSSVVARGNSSVVALENSSVVAWGNSSVEARGNSSVEAWENSSVVARGNSSVVALENSSVEAWENSSVEARGNTQVVDAYGTAKIEITGNARIVYNPKTIREYCDFYGIDYDKRNGRFFKAVHKIGGRYYSDSDNDYEYVIGSKQKPDAFDENANEDCGHGLHIAYLSWVLDYGKDWDDLAILEVEAVLDEIVVPNGSPGKVRAPELTVIREVPLEECGIYGKILAKRRKDGAEDATT